MERVVANHAVKKYAYKQSLQVQSKLTEVEEIRSSAGLHKIPSLENLQQTGGVVSEAIGVKHLGHSSGRGCVGGGRDAAARGE